MATFNTGVWTMLRQDERYRRVVVDLSRVLWEDEFTNLTRQFGTAARQEYADAESDLIDQCEDRLLAMWMKDWLSRAEAGVAVPREGSKTHQRTQTPVASSPIDSGWHNDGWAFRPNDLEPLR